MSDWLDGMRVLIAGGGSGIGRGVVDVFAEEGARVSVLEREAVKCEALVADSPAEHVEQADATDRKQVAAAVAAAKSALGGIDVVVNCVGIFDFYRKLAEIDADDLDDAFDEMFSVNVKSQLHVARASYDELVANKGSMILTESTSAYYAGRGGTLYVSSKFAVRGLVTVLAYEWAPSVRVNGVAPGGTLSTDLRGLSSLSLGERRLDGPNRAADLAANNPLNVALDGRDHAYAYAYLASKGARGVTGTVLHSDGGMAVKAK
ncbi:SDR family oxidoreductase [Mycobacterium sp. MBM]|nr:SDR family oxidoreductase [Mycobacterium sp. MBM]